MTTTLAVSAQMTLDGSTLFPVPGKDVFQDDKGRVHTPFIPAPPIEAIARRLVETEGGGLSLAKHARIDYVWRAKGGSSGGIALFGQCVRDSGLTGYYSQFDFTIWIAADHCRTARMTAQDMEALIYHQLLHVDQNDEGGWRVAPHDFQGFHIELERYGPWQRSLYRMAEIAQALELPTTMIDDEPSAASDQSEYGEVW